jgi:hypothetical protein
VKPGELERNLSRLVEAARAARERLASLEQDLAQLRREMESLAHPAPTEPRHGADGGMAPLDAHGIARRERAETSVRAEGDRPGREAGSE